MPNSKWPLYMDPETLAMTTRGKLTNPSDDFYNVRDNLAPMFARVRGKYPEILRQKNWDDMYREINSTPVSTERRDWDEQAGPKPKWFTGSDQIDGPPLSEVKTILVERLIKRMMGQ